ncbi:MAG: CPBP family intramembrane glutamic endopeptidase [Saprospiraceae bacterium]
MYLSIFQLLLIIAAIYLAWYLLHQLLFHQSFCRPANHMVESFYNRLFGFLFLGIIAYWVAHREGFTSSDLGIGFTLNRLSYTYILIALIILPLLMLYIGPTKENLWKNPKIRNHRWTWTLVLLSSISWIIFLFAYEFFFRGFLLFPCIHELGITWAVIINVLVYSLIHIGRGAVMTIGAGLFSIALSLISYHTGSFFAAFIIHVILALSNEWISLYYNPDMKVKGLA